jgi:hypothetical protein
MIDAGDGRYWVARLVPSPLGFGSVDVEFIGDHLPSEEADALLKLLNATNQGECNHDSE